MGSRTRTLMAATTRMLQLDREVAPLNIIHRQLGHANLRTTPIYQ
jgi:integrase